jgi:hypothetical protein
MPPGIRLLSNRKAVRGTFFFADTAMTGSFLPKATRPVVNPNLEKLFSIALSSFKPDLLGYPGFFDDGAASK